MAVEIIQCSVGTDFLHSLSSSVFQINAINLQREIENLYLPYPQREVTPPIEAFHLLLPSIPSEGSTTSLY